MNISRVSVRKKSSGAGYFTYKYKYEKAEIAISDVETLESIIFTFAPSMKVEDINKMREKWAHKIYVGERHAEFK